MAGSHPKRKNKIKTKKTRMSIAAGAARVRALPISRFTQNSDTIVNRITNKLRAIENR